MWSQDEVSHTHEKASPRTRVMTRGVVVETMEWFIEISNHHHQVIDKRLTNSLNQRGCLEERRVDMKTLQFGCTGRNNIASRGRHPQSRF